MRPALLAATCTLLAFLVVSAPQVRSADDWEPVFESENLRILRRDYTGSELDEMQGVVRVQASLGALMALLKDADFNRHWVYRSGGARVLRESGYAQAYVYGVVDAPFPLSDRDSVVRFDYEQDPRTKQITINITNMPDFVPPEPQLIRVPDIGGHWLLKPDADGWVEVTYQIHGDPGGWIPVWFVNRAAEVSVKATLQNLIEVVGRYEGARSEFVLEPDSPATQAAPNEPIPIPQ